MSWKTVELGTVCDFQNGFAFKSNLFSEDGLPILRISNIQNQRIDTNNLVFFKKESYREKIEQYEVKPNDLLIAMSGATTGKIGFNNTNKTFYLNQRVGNLKPRENLDKKYLYYFLLTQVEKNLSISAGAAQPNLSTEQIKGMQIPLPSLLIQQKIVTKLDAIFIEIDKAATAAAANAKNSEALFQSYLKKLFDDTNEKSTLRELGEITELITKGSSPKWQGISYVEKPGTLFVTSENVGVGTILLIKKKYVEDSFNQKNKKSQLKIGDVLTNIVGASIGRTAIFNINESANINQAVCLIRCNSELLSNKYLMYLFNSPDYIDFFHENEVDNARANLSLSFFSKLKIYLPSIEIQEITLQKIVSAEQEIDILFNNFMRKKDEMELLKNSILNKAFNGELVKEQQ